MINQPSLARLEKKAAIHQIHNVSLLMENDGQLESHPLDNQLFIERQRYLFFSFLYSSNMLLDHPPLASILALRFACDITFIQMILRQL